MSIVKFELVLKAYKNALTRGIDLSNVLARACTSESLPVRDMQTIMKFL